MLFNGQRALPGIAKRGQYKLKIAIIGAGAMGMLFGGYLSKHNEVVLIDTDQATVDKINRDGIRIKETSGTIIATGFNAAISSARFAPADLAILFVKSMHSKIALEANRKIIGPDTYVLSLQNGFGHDAILREFVAEDKIVVGTTQHNSSIIEPGVIRHGGGGNTYIGLLTGNGDKLKEIETAFNRCGIPAEISDNIREKVWEKLFVNASASVLSAIMQVNLGFLIKSKYAWRLTEQLIKEAVAAANGDGMAFEEEKTLEAIRRLIENASDAYTSIYADIRDGRKTEVDVISGAVALAAARSNTPAPGHEFVVQLIHAMEDRRQEQL
jgi:2-dehydropantoate 2-reductase